MMESLAGLETGGLLFDWNLPQSAYHPGAGYYLILRIRKNEKPHEIADALTAGFEGMHSVVLPLTFSTPESDVLPSKVCLMIH